MKINTVNSKFSTSSWGNGPANHWYINWDEGVTQGGSSGAPILNQDKLIVGQNHGKAVSQAELPVCDRKRSDAGKFHISWTGGGTHDSELAYWLNPIGRPLSSINTYTYIEGRKILGPSVVCNNAQYSLDDLPSGYNITWEVSGYVSAFLNKVVTSKNVYTLSRKNTDIDNAIGQVVAKIYSGDSLVAQITKDICVMDPTKFSGTYSQEACNFHGVSHPAITQKPLVRSSFHYVHQGCTVTLKSTFFKYMNFQWQSAVPDNVYYNGDNIITFSLPYLTGGIPYCLNLTAKDGENCNNCSLMFASNGNGNLSNNVLATTLTGSVFEVSIIEDVIDEYSFESKNQATNTPSTEWDLEVYSAETGKKIYNSHVKGNRTSFETSSWKSGVYLLKGVLNGVAYTNKIIVK